MFGGFGQVARIFLERVIAVLGACAISCAALADIIDGRIQGLGIDAPGIQRILGLGFDHRQRHQDTLDRNKTIASLGGNLFGLVQHLAGRAVQIDLPGVTCDLGQFSDGKINLLNHALGIPTRAINQVGCEPLFVVKQCLEEMFGRKPLMAFAHCNRLGRLHKTARPFGEFFQIHFVLLIKRPDHWVPAIAAHPFMGLAQKMGSQRRYFKHPH